MMTFLVCCDLLMDVVTSWSSSHTVCQSTISGLGCAHCLILSAIRLTLFGQQAQCTNVGKKPMFFQLGKTHQRVPFLEFNHPRIDHISCVTLLASREREHRPAASDFDIHMMNTNARPQRTHLWQQIRKHNFNAICSLATVCQQEHCW